MRLQPPNCSTCPDNMFIQAGQNNCQQCNSKCNGCMVSNNNCTVCNGLYRLSILYLQLFGQICILVLFGKKLAISIVIALSLFQTLYGIIFQMILSQMIKSKNSIMRHIGILIAISITGLCAYLIIASIALYTSTYQANIACLSYVASFCLDYFINSILVELGKYMLILKTCEKLAFYKLFNIIIPPCNQEFIFGRKLEQPQLKQPSTKTGI